MKLMIEVEVNGPYALDPDKVVRAYAQKLQQAGAWETVLSYSCTQDIIRFAANMHNIVVVQEGLTLFSTGTLPAPTPTPTPTPDDDQMPAPVPAKQDRVTEYRIADYIREKVKSTS